MQIHILSSPGKWYNYHPSKWKQTSHLLKNEMNNGWVWRFCANCLSFPAYHFQKSHFKISDVSLKYSGSHFVTTAYFKMTSLKDVVFLLSPLNFPNGVLPQLTFFITAIALQSKSWQPPGCAFHWSHLPASPKLTCGPQPKVSVSETIKGRATVCRMWNKSRLFLSKFRRSAGCS